MLEETQPPSASIITALAKTRVFIPIASIPLNAICVYIYYVAYNGLVIGYVDGRLRERPMGRRKLPDTMETVSVRLPQAVLDEIDAYLAQMKAEAPFLMLNRADAIRQLLAIGLNFEKNSRLG